MTRYVSKVIMKVGVGMVCLYLPLSALSSESTGKARYISRYSYVINNDSKHDPLLAMTSIRDIPKEYKTTLSAMEYVISQSGYHLTNKAKFKFKKISLPSVHRKVDYRSALEMLQILSGTPYQVVVDPVNRLIDFKLRQPYCQWGKI